MSRIPVPNGYKSWNEYIEAQADASVDQSRAARMQVKRDIKLGMISQTERQAAGNATGNLTVKWDPNYTGPGLYISPGGNTALAYPEILDAYNEDSTEPTMLTDFAISSNDKIMFSVQIFQVSGYAYIYGDPPEFYVDPYYTGIGIASRDMDLSYYIGGDGNSIALYSGGAIWRYPNNTIFDNNLAMSEGSIIDIAVDRGNNLVWFRIDNGDWNGINTDDPATASGGQDISFITGDVYLAAGPWYENRSSEITILNQPVYSVPAGFTFAGGNENSYREYNVYNTPGTTSPEVAHPWELQEDILLITESGEEITTESDENIEVEII